MQTKHAVTEFCTKVKALRLQNVELYKIRRAQTIHKVRYQNVTNEQRAELCRKCSVACALIFAKW